MEKEPETEAKAAPAGGQAPQHQDYFPTSARPVVVPLTLLLLVILALCFAVYRMQSPAKPKPAQKSANVFGPEGSSKSGGIKPPPGVAPEVK